jgi:DNA polymerase III epsilon subunit-like protein
VRSPGLPATDRHHRALADAEATAYLFLHIQQNSGDAFTFQQ